jgi:hypothetical protein
MLEILMMSCPYPTVNEQGVFRDGYLVRQPRACLKCDPKGCLTTLNAEQKEQIVHSVCPKGFSLVVLSWPHGRILCNGLIVAALNTVCPSSIRKAHQGQKVAWEEILSWHKGASKMIPLVDQCCDEKAYELIEGLHDVTTAVNLVTRNAEAIIAKLEGDTDDVKIDNAPPPLKSLLKSIELLHTRLSMSSIVANPESASFGQKHPVPVYKVFHRMVRLFEELAARQGVSIKMQGSSRLKPKCFDSIDTLALVLVDNAVKYSLQRNSVYVVVSDTNTSVKVAVQSYGPVVPKERQEKIFERGVRTQAAERFSSKGSGLGLYIARIVAEAHSFIIHYKCFDVSPSRSEGWNEFSFEVSLK